MIAETNTVVVGLSSSERKFIHRGLPGEEGPAKLTFLPGRPSGNTFVDKKIGLGKSHYPKVDYQVDHDTKELTIRVIDPETGEVIRQISGDDLLPFVSRSQRFNQNLLDTIA